MFTGANNSMSSANYSDELKAELLGGRAAGGAGGQSGHRAGR